MTSKRAAAIQLLCHAAENFEPEGVIDQDDSSPQVLFACADILLKWYQAEPGNASRGLSPEELVEVILEDLSTSLVDILAQRAANQVDACAEYPAGYTGRPDLEYADRNGAFGYWIGEDARPRGRHQVDGFS